MVPTLFERPTKMESTLPIENHRKTRMSSQKYDIGESTTKEIRNMSN